MNKVLITGLGIANDLDANCLFSKREHTILEVAEAQISVLRRD